MNYNILKPRVINPGDRTFIEPEQIIPNIGFNIHRFNERPRPENKSILAMTMFSEFGCESVSVPYLVPRMLQMHPGRYSVLLGWHGRAYLYRHLVDEFWELKEEHMWLREWARAFHHESKNLKKLEVKLAKQFGIFYPSGMLGRFFLMEQCARCSLFHEGTQEKCPKCGSVDLLPPMAKNAAFWRQRVVRIPQPREEIMEWARTIVKPNTIGIFARGRRTYGRNLPPEYYKSLIEQLQSFGYGVIWLGEKVTVQPCPVDTVYDFSRSDDARDLEKTFAILSLLKCTIQYWTASTRLATMMGTPYILFESPDQIWGVGQEGLRRQLCDFGPSKLVACHYKDAAENLPGTLDYTMKALTEVESGNYQTMMAFNMNSEARDALIAGSKLNKQKV